MMKTYRFLGSHALLTDAKGTVQLTKNLQTVDIDSDRAEAFIAAGAQLIESTTVQPEETNASPVI